MISSPFCNWRCWGTWRKGQSQLLSPGSGPVVSCIQHVEEAGCLWGPQSALGSVPIIHAVQEAPASGDNLGASMTFLQTL